MGNFKVDILGGLDLGKRIADVGSTFAEAQEKDRLKNERLKMQEAIKGSVSGDPESLELLHTINPNMAMAYESRMQQKAERLGAEKAKLSKDAEVDFGLKWKQAKTPEQFEALKQEALADPLIDFDEEDLEVNPTHANLAINSMLFKHLGKGGYGAILGGGAAEYQKSTKGLVFNKTTGEYSIDPTYATNIKQLNDIALDYQGKIKKLEEDSSINKKRLEAKAGREKDDIKNGVDAAQGYGTLVRADKLLDMVGTGKPQQALLWGKKMLGVEGANEVELENLLGKRIIAQLKPTFGAQFTKSEGDWLKSMEADFGKSTEGNRRLIRQGMDLVKQRAKIGLDAAGASGDIRSSKNIQEWLDFRYTADPKGENEGEQGTIMIDAQGNRARVFEDGTFEEL
jgi:hypothetical protein